MRNCGGKARLEVVNMEKTDRRVIKTKQAIQDAFERLIVDVDYEKITVSALAREANINRKTFYLHYDSVEDVLNNLARDHAQNTVKMIAEKGLFDKGQIDANAIAETIGESYREARLFNPLFIHKLPTAHLIDAVQPELENYIAKVRSENGLPELDNLSYYVRFFLGGVLQAYECWYNTADNVQFDEIARVVSEALAHGLNGVVGEES